MVIKNSQVSMASKSYRFDYVEVKTAQLEEREGTQIKLDTSEDAKSLMDQVKEHQEEKEKQQKEREEQGTKQLMALFKENQAKKSDTVVSNEEDMQVRLLRMLLDSLKRMSKKGSKANSNNNSPKDLIEQGLKNRGFAVTSKPTGATGSAPQNNIEGEFNVIKMVRTKVVSAFESHSENMAFEGVGHATTTDGRSIDFGITMEMSQSFCRQYEEFSVQKSFFVDPLVINLDSSTAQISDQKFLFDLDCDGKEDKISFTGPGSGFLAYDRNGDGTINDGSELFGTKSGDGFADLAKYDKDGNGWIDEADDIYKKLKVWTKDKDGNDKLLDLKDANVGAIYLGNTNTRYTMYNEDYSASNAQIRKTGLFLKETGEVGTIQHVDLAI